jgi:hypothetical protein
MIIMISPSWILNWGMFDGYNNAAPSGLKYDGPFVAIIVSPFQGFLDPAMLNML